VHFSCAHNKTLFDHAPRKQNDASKTTYTFFTISNKGFDSKWQVQEEKKKKLDGWEEVLIKGSKQKKQLSGAEKRARAQKISEAVICLLIMPERDIRQP
jgi:hypothetical protein